MIKLLYPNDGFVFDTHTDVQNEFIARIHRDGIDSATEWLEPVKNGQEISYPRELTFSWDGEEEEFALDLSLTPDFCDADTYVTKEKSYTLDNLMIGTTYFWRVNGCEARSFSTLGAEPRFIKIGGVPNVRDIGGGKIKQGLLFRGGELERCYAITDDGKDTFVKRLKIKTELDLRADRIGKITSSPAGNTVNLVQLPYRPYSEVFEDTHKEGIVRIMEFLSEESNYPVFFHCLGGADRTGMIALFLRALVGEDDDSIHTDYELTSLSAYAMGIAEGAAATGFRRRTSTYYMNFLDMLKQYAPDEPLSGQVREFLLSCGLDMKFINKIINIIGVA